jgi:mRNA-degrading endonuclease RelE of RelBE toxin-antitoxin system
MEDKPLPIKIDKSIEFKKNIKKLEKKYRSIEEDLEPLIQQLESGETPGDRISGNKYPVYKVRVKNSDNKKGQSSGYRVIYYTITPESILLTTIYSKSERGNISNREIEDLIEQEEIKVEQQDREIVTTDAPDVESGENS